MLAFQVVCKALSSFTLEDMVAREGVNYVLSRAHVRENTVVLTIAVSDEYEGRMVHVLGKNLWLVGDWSVHECADGAVLARHLLKDVK
ncbi:MAG: hypothetical protein Q4E82_04975 [Peptococcaceae bacterium]|nr:hypothetical protein [Peptococcaceae bacterium]